MIGQDDEALLSMLADVAAAEDEASQDPRWEALAADALDPNERAALEVLAAADPAGAEKWAAFEPRDAAFDEAIVASILAQTTTASGEEGDRTGSSTLAPVAILSPPRRRWHWAVGALAVAAALLVFALRNAPPLPTYTLESLAGEQAMRGDLTDGAAVYGPGSQVDLILRPEVDATEAVGIQAFHKVGDEIRRLSVTPTMNANGIFRLRGLVEEILPAGSGAHQLIFAIGRPDALPKSVDAVKNGLLNGPDGWQILRHDYRRR